MDVDERNGSANAIVIRHITELSDLERCVELQVAVWGYSDGDVIPRRVFVIATRIGGQVLGAYSGEDLVGFAMALPGCRAGMSYLHSHMLAVLPPFRNAGVGRRLKLAQREDALSRGFELMEWTFDPLEIKNAHLNLHKLGAISRRYQKNFYGASSSPLQGGLPTDRLYAEWWLRSARVERALQGELRTGRAAEVEVPHEIYEWKRSGDPRAAETQTRVCEQLLSAFAKGLVAVDYHRSSEGGGSFVLGKVDGPEDAIARSLPIDI